MDKTISMWLVLAALVQRKDKPSRGHYCAAVLILSRATWKALERLFTVGTVCLAGTQLKFSGERTQSTGVICSFLWLPSRVYVPVKAWAPVNNNKFNTLIHFRPQVFIIKQSRWSFTLTCWNVSVWHQLFFFVFFFTLAQSLQRWWLLMFFTSANLTIKVTVEPHSLASFC